jgi:hypothetical protein
MHEVANCEDFGYLAMRGRYLKIILESSRNNINLDSPIIKSMRVNLSG